MIILKLVFIFSCLVFQKGWKEHHQKNHTEQYNIKACLYCILLNLLRKMYNNKKYQSMNPVLLFPAFPYFPYLHPIWNNYFHIINLSKPVIIHTFATTSANLMNWGKLNSTFWKTFHKIYFCTNEQKCQHECI